MTRLNLTALKEECDRQVQRYKEELERKLEQETASISEATRQRIMSNFEAIRALREEADARDHGFHQRRITRLTDPGMIELANETLAISLKNNAQMVTDYIERFMK